MDGASCTSRRKACDLCVSRKIKCDSLKPTCTNCTLYGAACKITASTRHPTKKRALSSNGEREAKSITPTETNNDRVDALEARLVNIEALLGQMAARIHETATSQHRETNAARDVSMQACMSDEVAPTPTCPANTSTAVQPTENLELPPLPEVLPLVDKYFKSYNHFNPLFDEPSFMRMLLNLYSSPSKRPVVPWAAVNVVLAINHRIIEGLPMEDPKVASCLQNVQSIMALLMTWQEDLLGLQVLLGMALVNQGCVEPQLSMVLMGSVIRIAQRMRLHSKQALLSCSPAVALQRRRLFWIAYILDRDIALRACSPYIQLDSETDLDMPEKDPEDGIGILWSAKANARFNFLRARVQLAFIQGKAHDIMYSQRAQTLTPQQRQTQIARIERMLYDWQKHIPDEFQRTENVTQLPPMSAQFMMNIFFRHVEVLFRIHSIFSFDITWISRVTRYLSPAVIELGDGETDGEVVRSELTPLPAGWSECVQYCRRCLPLSCLSHQTDYSVWLHACGTFSSLIVLIVNMIEFPDHEAVAEDNKLIEDWHKKFIQMGLKVSYEHSEMFNILEQLERRARGQIKRIAQSKSSVTEFSALVDEELLAQFDWAAPVNIDL
ncbi:fungal-specific transcription factor domain-containing protein [Thelonectria olida]|uniref:Fungal-specific transcription factor domain-containing protein n=1 Tax=Thelonectria olida TaxID=1576542 RepID=A0A9P8W189_9HYPO|nr:fungal-specific transcription factor domain-containing protein [Thelonectria olida]